MSHDLSRKHFFGLLAAHSLQIYAMGIFDGMRMYIVETKLGPFSVSTVQNMIKAKGKPKF